MTRDQAEKIAKAVMDEIEQSRLISKDRLTDAIFNSWHKSTADEYRASFTSDPAYEKAFTLCVGLGLDPQSLLRSPQEVEEVRAALAKPASDFSRWCIAVQNGNGTTHYWQPGQMQLDD